jgi:hypothetical protein
MYSTVCVPDKRRLGHVNVICGIAIACVSGKGGKRGAMGPKSGAVDSGHGAREGRSLQLRTKSYHSK